MRVYEGISNQAVVIKMNTEAFIIWDVTPCHWVICACDYVIVESFCNWDMCVYCGNLLMPSIRCL